MSIGNKLKPLKDALTSLNVPCYHYYAPSERIIPYIVWYEDGEVSSLEANNHKAEQALSGYVEYFTQTEFDPVVDSIQDKLNSVENLAWTYESVIYGDPSNEDNNTIHHSWSWGVM